MSNPHGLRTYRQLTHANDAMGLVHDWVAHAPHHAEVLGCSSFDGQRAVEALQVTTRSPLGALALHTGGILVDHGWLRVLGAGCDRLPRAIDRWNDLHRDTPRCSRGLVVADDAVGGFFAWFRQPQTVHYFAPDSMEWEDLDLGYAEWLAAMLTGRLAAFYTGLRWPGWKRQIEEMHPGHAFSGASEREAGEPVPLEVLWTRAQAALAPGRRRRATR